MIDEAKCNKIYHKIVIMGKSVRAHIPDMKICSKCPYFTLDGCNSYRRFKAEELAKKIVSRR